MTPYLPPAICQVNKVIDGDTLECNKLKIRLCGLDSPEISQPYCSAATAKLTQLALNKNVRLIPSGKDNFGRIIAEVWLNNRLLNAEMLRAGLANSYGSCPTQKTVLINAEKVAIANKLGNWHSELMRSWIYRYKYQLIISRYFDCKP
jgi:micrococcal nuclease